MEEQNNTSGMHLSRITAIPVSLRANMRAFQKLYENIKCEHPGWLQDEILTNLRKTDYGTPNSSLWEIAKPFSRGDSYLSVTHQAEFQRLRQRMLQCDRLDIGHVLTAVDVEIRWDIIINSHASWAADLGIAVLEAYIAGTDVKLGSSSASPAELLADIDGANIANSMTSGHEMDAIVAYYLGVGDHCGGVDVHSRFTTFADALQLIEPGGHLKPDAPDIINKDISCFIYQNNFIDNLRGFMDGRLPGREFTPCSDIPRLITQSANRFIEFVYQGVMKEQ